MFGLLDWDDDHRVRILRLALLPADSLNQCVKALALSSPPTWPVWVPSRWKLPSEEARAKADHEVERVLDRAKPAVLVVAWAGYGDTILAAQNMPAAELANVSDWFSRADATEGHDWFSLLELQRRKGVA
jgi:hypothetical protein